MSRIPPQDRNLDHLHPLFRPKFEKWLAAARKAGFDVKAYETFRTHERQRYLYSLGRTRPGARVTFTLDSAHMYGLAADVMILRGKQVDWSWAAYQRLYRAVPPSKFGLEILDWEMPHIQLAGIQGPRKNQRVAIWAAKHRIQAGVIVHSRHA